MSSDLPADAWNARNMDMTPEEVPAWPYFGERYDLRQVGVLYPFPGRELSPRALAALGDEARRAGVQAVFTEPQLGETGAKALADELGARIGTLDPLGGPEVAGRDSYEGYCGSTHGNLHGRWMDDMNETAAVSFEDVSFSYNGTNTLEGASFAIGRGRFAALIGPNGAGKTTALRLLLGIMQPTRGQVWLIGARPGHQNEIIGSFRNE